MARRRSTLTENIVFDPRLGSTGRYVNDRTGKMLPAQFVQDQLEKQIEFAGDKMTKLGVQLAKGDISLATWRQDMASQMKIIHTQSAALSKGGWEQMTQSDWGAVGRIARQQYRFLDDFALAIQSGEQKILNLAGDVNGSFLRRIDLYANAGNSVKSQMERREAERNGLTHEQRVLDPSAQHCQCCIQNAGRWAIIGTLPKLGECDCSNNDRCHFIYGRRGDDGLIVKG